VASRVQTAAIPAAAAPAVAAKRAPGRMPAPASIDEDDDALIPIESEFGDLDDPGADLIEDAAHVRAARPLVASPDANTQPELAASAPVRANEVELSENDLVALDTGDLDSAIDEEDSLFDTSGTDLSAEDPESGD
jgi:hypothetical protein